MRRQKLIVLFLFFSFPLSPNSNSIFPPFLLFDLRFFFLKNKQQNVFYRSEIDPSQCVSLVEHKLGDKVNLGRASH